MRDVAASKTTQMSVDASLTPLSNGHSHAPSISSDGSLVAYSSYASNLVSGDVNGYEDVFVFDRVNKIATLVSESSALTQGDNDSSGAAISADGKFVAFASQATNLVASDTNSVSEIFEHEIATANTTRMSVDSSGAEGDFDSYSPAINSDGTVVAFESLSDNLSPNDTNGLTDVFAHDVGTAATDCMTLNAVGVPSDGFGSYRPELSGDGVLVAFTSSADNLVTGDSNGVFDVFLRDRSLPPRSASWAQYGNGFPGTLFTPSLTASANPVFGAPITLDADNSSGGPTFGLLFVGAGSTSLQTNKGGQIHRLESSCHPHRGGRRRVAARDHPARPLARRRRRLPPDDRGRRRRAVRLLVHAGPAAHLRRLTADGSNDRFSSNEARRRRIAGAPRRSRRARRD